MNSFKFYMFFNIFNILLIGFIILCIYISAYLIWDMRDLTIANIKFLCGIALMITYITLKLRLPKIFSKVAKKYDNSIISHFVNYLANNPNIKKKILLFAFCYDLPFLIYAQYPDFDHFYMSDIIDLTLLYIIFYVGGVFFFYLMLYKEIKKIRYKSFKRFDNS